MAAKRHRESKKPAADRQPASSRLVVTFSKAHTHRGVSFAKGDTLEATPAERDLLRHFDVIEAD